MKLCTVLLLTGAALMTSCSDRLTEDQRFESLANQYINELLESDPELATSLGDHRFDNRLKDYSLIGVQDQLRRHRRYLSLLSTTSPSRLNATNQIDRDILISNIEANIFQIEILREHAWNPLGYSIGRAIYGLTARDFAPLKVRMRNLIERLKAIPRVIEAARRNLKNCPRIHTETAILQNQGTAKMVRDELNGYLEQVPELKPEFRPAQVQAVAALETYGSWLQQVLLPNSQGDFRLGIDRFRSKLKYNLDSELSLEEILRRAQQDLKLTQNSLFETALPLYERYFPEKASARSGEGKKVVIRAVLDKLAQEHPSNKNIVELARRDLDSITAFVRERQLVSVPDEPIRVIVMPEFQRGVAVAYCDSPGPLEERAETFFAISPTPADWPPERVLSFFREYNNTMIQNLTIHEAMPGHYLQLMHSNRFHARTPVRSVFSSGPFIEGWATYAEQLMVEQGFGGPEVKIQQLKMRLRLIINAIIDQGIHTAGMTEKEAMDLMMNEGFQEEGEAAGKWRRACLTSTQLSTYYIGNIEINDIRKAVAAKHGSITDLKSFHDKLLSFGSPPPKHVKELMGL
jgi:uncharacterized protein (DUF885 family)